MQARWRMGFAGAVALVGAGCGAESSGGSAASTAMVVDCVGLARSYPLAGHYIVSSLYDGRCDGMLSDTIGSKSLRLGGNVLGSPDSAQLVLQFRQKSWAVRSGTVELTRLEDGLAEGRYRGEAIVQATGETATVEGRIDWCDYVQRRDCPQSPSRGLTKQVSFQLPNGMQSHASKGETLATECRVLFDRASGAVRVDLQLGVLDGVNHGVLSKHCDQPVLPAAASFEFRARDVAKAGAYGPVAAAPRGAVFVPGFSLQLPMALLPEWYGAFNACQQLYTQRAEAYAEQGTTCTWTISESPGRFELDCADAAYREPGSAVPERGKFHLAADCDVRAKE